MVWKKIGILAGLALFGIGLRAYAKPPALEDPLLKADFGSEHNRGGTNAVTGLGNGRLTIGISPWSELVYFRWPRPSAYEQLRYLTVAYFARDLKMNKDARYSDDAPSIDWRRYGRPYEVYPGLGAKGGIYFQDGSINWFGDPSWVSKRAYQPESGPVLCTTLSNPKAFAKICQWVDWEDDLLVQDFQIESEAARKFFYYGTFDPYDKDCHYKGAPDPIDAGFATAYLPDSGIILYFSPKNKNPKKLLSRPQGNFSGQMIDRLYPEGGYFVAMGLILRPDHFQVGADRKGRKVSASAPLAASEQAASGQLADSDFFMGQSDSGLEKSISTPAEHLVILISAASSATQAVSILEAGRAKGVESLRSKAVSDWNPISERINISPQASASEKRVAQRSILNLFVGRDRESGAIVASPSRQPPYHFDWPRDGAFFDLSLDLAGFPEIAGSHLDFYRRTQRRELLDYNWNWIFGLKNIFYSPRGHWYPHYYTDGRPGRISLPLEIDETALMAWDLWRHEQYIPQAGRAQYQKEHLEQLTFAADALLEYVDLKNGWTKKAMEDDNSKPNNTLHGASSVLAGLASAVDAGKKWGANPKKVERWQEAAIALREGILRRITDDQVLKKGGWRGLQWTLFPAPVFEKYDDPRAQKLIKKLAYEVEQNAYKKRPGFAYLGEQVFILAVATAEMPEYRPVLEQALRVLTDQAPIPGADTYGEVTIWIDLPGSPEKIAEQRTSIPHLWTGVTSYLSVESIYRPERLRSQIPPVP